MDAFHFRQRTEHGTAPVLRSTRFPSVEHQPPSPRHPFIAVVQRRECTTEASRLSSSKLATASGALRRMSDVPVSCGMMDRPIPSQYAVLRAECGKLVSMHQIGVRRKPSGLLAFTGYSVTRRCVQPASRGRVLVTHLVTMLPPQRRLYSTAIRRARPYATIPDTRSQFSVRHSGPAESIYGHTELRLCSRNCTMLQMSPSI